MTGSKRKYTSADAVYKKLQAYFAESNFTVGEQVPPERELAETLAVNRTTLRSAMHRLVKEGMLDRHVGRGTFFKMSPASIVDNYRRVSIDCSPAELLEMRFMLEPQIASLAVTHATGHDVDVLNAYLKEVQNVTPDKLESEDIRFHELLTSMCSNSLLKEMYSVVTTLRKKFLMNNSGRMIAGLSFMDINEWRQHQTAICTAIDNRDKQATMQAMTVKINSLFQQFVHVARADSSFVADAENGVF